MEALERAWSSTVISKRYVKTAWVTLSLVVVGTCCSAPGRIGVVQADTGPTWVTMREFDTLITVLCCWSIAAVAGWSANTHVGLAVNSAPGGVAVTPASAEGSVEFAANALIWLWAGTGLALDVACPGVDRAVSSTIPLLLAYTLPSQISVGMEPTDLAVHSTLAMAVWVASRIWISIVPGSAIGPAGGMASTTEARAVWKPPVDMADTLLTRDFPLAVWHAGNALVIMWPNTPISTLWITLSAIALTVIPEPVRQTGAAGILITLPVRVWWHIGTIELSWPETSDTAVVAWPDIPETVGTRVELVTHTTPV